MEKEREEPFLFFSACGRNRKADGRTTHVLRPAHRLHAPRLPPPLFILFVCVFYELRVTKQRLWVVEYRYIGRWEAGQLGNTGFSAAKVGKVDRDTRGLVSR